MSKRELEESLKQILFSKTYVLELVMSKTVVIYLDFEDIANGYEIDDAEVYNYLYELMEDNSLSWEYQDEV